MKNEKSLNGKELEIKNYIDNLAYDIYGPSGTTKPYCCGYFDLLNTFNDLDFSPFDKESVLYAGLAYMLRDWIQDYHNKQNSKKKDWLDFDKFEWKLMINDAELSKYGQKVKQDLEFISDYFGGSYLNITSYQDYYIVGLSGGRRRYSNALLRLMFDEKYKDFSDRKNAEYELKQQENKLETADEMLFASLDYKPENANIMYLWFEKNSYIYTAVPTDHLSNPIGKVSSFIEAAESCLSSVEQGYKLSIGKTPSGKDYPLSEKEVVFIKNVLKNEK